MKDIVKCKECICVYENANGQYECRRKPCIMDNKGIGCWPLLYRRDVDDGICGCYEGIDKFLITS